jgi:hypothetical protein
VSLCLVLFAALLPLAGCSSDPQVRSAETVAGAMVASQLIGEIATFIRPLPAEPNNPIDNTHSKVIFTNATNRAVRINLEGPRTYEVNVGHGGEINLIVVPGNYTSRISGPSLKTTLNSYTFQGGQAYEYHVAIEGRHEPR